MQNQNVGDNVVPGTASDREEDDEEAGLQLRSPPNLPQHIPVPVRHECKSSECCPEAFQGEWRCLVLPVESVPAAIATNQSIV